MQVKTLLPMEIVTGFGLGVCYSSLTQIGSILPSKKLGEANLACYANISTGNLVVFDRPACFEERNFTLVLQYIYNSQAPINEAWRFSLKQFKEPLEHGCLRQTLTLIEEDGHETPFTLHPAFEKPTWLSPLWGKNGQSFLQFDVTCGQWVLFDPETQMSEYFDPMGRLLSRCDALQRETTWHYEEDAPFELSRIIGPGNAIYSLEKIKEGKEQYVHLWIRSADNQSSRMLQQWTFDKEGLLLNSLIESESGFPHNYLINYQYDAQKKLHQIKQNDATVLNFGYALKTLEKIAFGVEEQPLEWELGFDSSKASFFLKGPEGQPHLFKMDADNQLQSLVCYPYEDADENEALIKSFEYIKNQVSAICHPNGALESFLYHERSGRLEKQMHSCGKVIENSYDDKTPFRLLSTTVYQNAKKPATTHLVYENGVSCKKQKNGQTGFVLRFQISPESRVCEYRYDEKGDVASQRVWFETCPLTSEAINYPNVLAWVAGQNPASCQLTSFQTNAFGQVETTKTFTKVDENGEGQACEDTGLLLQNYHYSGIVTVSERRVSKEVTSRTSCKVDALFRPILIINPLLQKTKFEYEQLIDKNRVQNDKTQAGSEKQETLIKNSQGLTIEALVRAENTLRKTQMEWSKDSNLVFKKTEPNGLVYLYFYDTLHQLRAKLSPAGIVEEYKENRHHNWRSVTVYAKTLATESPTNFTALQTAMKNATFSEDKDKKVSYQFLDEMQQLRFQVNAENVVQEIRYDLTANITATIDYETPLSPQELADLKKGLALSRIIHPATDRCNRRFYDKDGLLLAEQDAAGFIKTFKRNGAGFLLETLTYATAQPMDFDKMDWESLNLQVSENDVRESFFYNNRGDCILSIDAGSYATAFSYFANGKVRQSRRFEARIHPVSGKNHLLPALPRLSDNDELIDYDYDLEEKPISVHTVNEGFKNLFSYAAEGNTTGKVRTETQKSKRPKTLHFERLEVYCPIAFSSLVCSSN